jgi:hypothetical protein
MPNKRGADQVLVAFALDAKLAGALDQARCKSGENRSAFVRKAIAEELRKRGHVVAPGTERAPDRVKTKYPAAAPSGAELNERPGKGKK